jgi:succinate dehydrogenase/fumarate reductase flavoprotein subunit
MSVFEDLRDFGVEFLKNEDGSWVKKGMEELGPCTCVFPNEPKTPHSVKLREKVLASGCVIMDRTMIVELVKEGNRVVGAMGFAVSDADPCLFEAKTVVLCAGACGFKPPGWPISNLTADGDMMAYRAGADITGKEFVDVHTVSPDSPAYVGPSFLKRPPGFTPPLPKYMTGDGTVKRMLRFHLGPEFDVHKGLAPIYGRYLAETPPAGADWPAEMITGSSMGMSAHRCEGIWPEGFDCSTQIEGLYAAGDSLGIMLCGAAYSALGIALSGCGVTGAIAGKTAAAYARGAKRPSVMEKETAAVFAKIFEPLNRRTGFKPAWVIQLLQNLMTPYFISFIKKEDRLLSALTQVEFYRDHLIPRLRAGDAHELRLAIEVQNMIGNAEMRLRASLMRKESRGTHYREDYPERDDDNWYRWIKIRQIDGKMCLTTVSVPEEWRKPEDEPYSYEFPSFSDGE